MWFFAMRASWLKNGGRDRFGRPEALPRHSTLHRQHARHQIMLLPAALKLDSN